MSTLELPFGTAALTLDPGVDQSPLGPLIHCRQRTVRGVRTWTPRWDGRGLGAVAYMEQLYRSAGSGAGAITWYPPNNGVASVRVRFLNFSVSMRSPQSCEITATLEEALEPC